ncbi:hypothetical protein GCM10027280_45470 [Micromonospora polyrhachis]|uniref:Terminase n=1 Tax=Micromonospora polyrhachis TaxID=1282883 RepID=A0A7W7WPQ1_9ACTN|nr:hypothetical protein [Micromonospora polyrhachis]MBB4958939.1 hypothetical protein [Micromonospora polyrhachis]
MSEFVVDFPTLGDLIDAWIERHCRVPDKFKRGDPFRQADWQFWCTANHYRVREGIRFVAPEDADEHNQVLLNQAFVYRRSLIAAPQKTGKGPWSASLVAVEACGPSLFAGWAEEGDVYRCDNNGCGCGWEYEYLPGEPKGMRHPSPLIQLTANAEDQVDNVYKPLKAMIRLGPLSELLLVREGFIRIAGLSDDEDLDRIDVVTSSARTRLGNPITFAMQDEAGLYTKANKMIDVAETQRRGAAGMGGRTVATTNAWNPAEDSYAQRTYESASKDIFRFYRDPDKALRGRDGKPLRYAVKRERRLIHEYVYAGSWWVNLDSIEADAAELMETDPAQAERFFGNRLVYGSGSWCNGERWDARAAPREVPDGTPIVLGLDGSDVDDWTVIRAETQAGYQFTPTYGPDRRPTIWDPAQWSGQVPRSEVRAAVDELFARYQVVRMYGDPPYWETELDEFAAQYGEKRVVRWETYRPVQMHAAAERLLTDVNKVDSGWTHDGCRITAIQVRNARKLARNNGRYVLGKPAQAQKIDACVTSIICHEAAGDVTAAGLWPKPKTRRKLIVM